MNDISRDIIERARAGDMEAFEALYKYASGFVYNVALRIVQRPFDADEVTQDVFIRIHKSLKEFEFKSSFRTWAYRITVNLALNHIRKSARDKDVIDMEDIAIIPAKEDAVNNKIEAEDNALKVEKLLSVLNPDQRACVVLRELEGLDYKDIAATLSIPVNTVRTRLLRAREAMAAFAKKGVAQDEVR